jgi:hypothetical protein
LQKPTVGGPFYYYWGILSEPRTAWLAILLYCRRFFGLIPPFKLTRNGHPQIQVNGLALPIFFHQKAITTSTFWWITVGRVCSAETSGLALHTIRNPKRYVDRPSILTHAVETHQTFQTLLPSIRTADRDDDRLKSVNHTNEMIAGPYWADARRGAGVNEIAGAQVVES